MHFGLGDSPYSAGNRDRAGRHHPVVCGSIFLTLTPKLSPSQKRHAASKVALSILIILVASALIGLKLFAIFGISWDVFRIVGRLIIAYMGFDMLRGSQTVGQAAPTDGDTVAPSSLAPLIVRRQRWGKQNCYLPEASRPAS